MTGKIPEYILAEIRDRVSIKEVVEDYVSLKKDGANYKGLCPFHQEKTPSFKVHEGKGIYKCFGCGAAGNVFTFLMQMEGMSFREAAERLAARAGVTLPRLEPSPEEAEKEKDLGRLFTALAQAAAYYQRLLGESAEAERARDYLQSRGITRETALRYQLGYSLPSWENLEAALRPRGVTALDLHAAGLLIPSERGRFYDRFRGRLMFPIVDVQGRVRGFGARLLEDEPDQPKYLNSPETPVYKKGMIFYGLYQAKEAIRRQKRVLVVEGYFDQIALDQAAVPYAVATLGTALTPEHVRVLRRYAAEVFLVFDADAAGQAAALRALDPFLEEGVTPRLVQIPEGKDPDEYLARHSREDLERLLQSAPPLLSYYLEKTISAAAATPGSLARAVTEIAAQIGRLADSLERSMFTEMLARKAGVPLAQVQSRLRRPEKKGERAGGQTAEALPEFYPRPEVELIRLFLHHPDLADRILTAGVIRRFRHPGLAALLRQLIEQWQSVGRTDPAALLPEISEPELEEWFSRVIFERDPFGEAAVGALEELIRQVSLGDIEAQLAELRRQIEQCVPDEGKWRSLLARQQALLAEQSQLGMGEK